MNIQKQLVMDIEVRTGQEEEIQDQPFGSSARPSLPTCGRCVVFRRSHFAAQAALELII